MGTGELLIRNVTFADAGAYRCQARHQLTEELRTSDDAGRLIVTGEFLLFNVSVSDAQSVSTSGSG